MSIYETGKALLKVIFFYFLLFLFWFKQKYIYINKKKKKKVGVVCGWDCTVEAMSSKLAFLLSKNYTSETIR